jgi:hypothetical protein
VRLLPAVDRACYDEEFHSELWEIAGTGAGCRRQCQYAARQVLRVVHVRGALLTSRRRARHRDTGAKAHAMGSRG